MRRILTEPGVAKIRRFGLGIVLIWGNVVGWIDKRLGCLENKTRDILCKEKKECS